MISFLNFQIFIFTIIFNLSNGVDIKKIILKPSEDIRDTVLNTVWTWECIKDIGCRKFLVNEKKHCADDNNNENDCKNIDLKNITIISEDVCNLLCPPGNLWPKPSVECNISTVYVPIDMNNVILNIQPRKNPNLPSEKKIVDNSVLKNGTDLFLNRFQNLGRNLKSKHLGRGIVITILIDDESIYKFDSDIDESYSLEIHQNTEDQMINATISGNNYFGVRHGLETFSQLLVFDVVSGTIVTANDVKIVDKPKYAHRGIMIDTARNYISLPALLRTIDAMSLVKLNTLHWHLTDSQSFPFVSKSLPEFSMYGAYSSEKVYTEEDINLITDYGKLRGVRIVPELDLPAHVGEGWQGVPGAVVCFNAQPWSSYCVEPPCGQIDPTENVVYDILKKLYKDLNELFDSDMFHMGGDEVNLNCWNSSMKVTSNMKKQGLEPTIDGFNQLWSNFQSKAKDLLKETGGNNKKLVLWTSSLTSGDLDRYLNNKDYIIQVWTTGTDPSIKNLLMKGFRIILSNFDSLYFDCGFGAWIGTGNNWCSPYIPWQKVYANTPSHILHKLGIESSSHDHLILGSEAALWTEQADESSLDNRLWPRGAALAESLWSPGLTWKEAESRYLLQRDRFIKKGISADSVEPEWCRQNQGFCNF